MKTVRSQFAVLLAGLAALSLVSAPMAAAPTPPPGGATQAPADPNKPVQPNETKEFGDWVVRCYPVNSPSPCEMLELLVNKKTGRRVLGLLIAFVPSRDQHVMQIALPLGVMLSNGAVLATDTFTTPTMKFRRCDLQGCYVETGLDNDTINSLARATKAEMRILSVDGKKFNLNFSLNGFSSAHSALVTLARQKASGGSTPAPAATPAPANYFAAIRDMELWAERKRPAHNRLRLFVPCSSCKNLLWARSARPRGSQRAIALEIRDNSDKVPGNGFAIPRVQ